MMNPYNPYFQSMTQPMGMGESSLDPYGMGMMGFNPTGINPAVPPADWARRSSISSNTSTDSIPIPIEHFDKDGNKIEKKK